MHFPTIINHILYTKKSNLQWRQAWKGSAYKITLGKILEILPTEKGRCNWPKSHVDLIQYKFPYSYYHGRLPLFYFYFLWNNWSFWPLTTINSALVIIFPLFCSSMYLYKEIATFKNNHLHSFRIDEAAFFSKSPLTLQKICDQIITTYNPSNYFYYYFIVYYSGHFIKNC